MKPSLVFACILVGMTSIVAAEPAPPSPPKPESAAPKTDEASGRVSYVEPKNGAEAKLEQPRATGQWIEIATPTPASHGTEFIMVGEEAGSFSQLWLAPAKGTTTVRSVRVFYTDGTNKRFRVDTAINKKGRRFAVVDLKGNKAIDHLVVNTENSKGTYAVYGASGSSAEVGTTAVSSR
jgi:hypothetical protein